MSFRSSLNKFRSPEGPFAKTPKWMKKLVPDVANVLGIGVYELDERHRCHIARFIAKNKEATLFVFFRILQEVVLVSGTDDKDFVYTGHILCRLFGEAGGEAIVEAMSKYRSDGDAIAVAKRRGYILAHAATGDESILTSVPEFEVGIAGGKEFAALGPGIRFNRDVEFAFWGLHYLWFSKLLVSEEFVEWINTMAAGDAAAEAMYKILKMMDPK